jgi:hypothetical protein
MNRRLALAGSLATISRLVLSFTMRLAIAEAEPPTFEHQAGQKKFGPSLRLGNRQHSGLRQHPQERGPTTRRSGRPRSRGNPSEVDASQLAAVHTPGESRRLPRASLQSVLTGIALNAARTCRVSSSIRRVPLRCSGKTRLDPAALSPTGVLPLTPEEVAAETLDLAFWNSVKDSDRREEFRLTWSNIRMATSPDSPGPAFFHRTSLSARLRPRLNVAPICTSPA